MYYVQSPAKTYFVTFLYQITLKKKKSYNVFINILSMNLTVSRRNRYSIPLRFKDMPQFLCIMNYNCAMDRPMDVNDFTGNSEDRTMRFYLNKSYIRHFDDSNPSPRFTERSVFVTAFKRVKPYLSICLRNKRDLLYY